MSEPSHSCDESNININMSPGARVSYNLDWNEHIYDNELSKIPDIHKDSIFNDEMFTPYLPSTIIVSQIPTNYSEKKLDDTVNQNVEIVKNSNITLNSDHAPQIAASEYTDHSITQNNHQTTDSVSTIDTPLTLIKDSTINIKFVSDSNGINILSTDGTVIGKPSEHFVSMTDMRSATLSKLDESQREMVIRSVDVPEFIMAFMCIYRSYLHNLQPDTYDATSADTSVFNHINTCDDSSCEMIFCRKIRHLFRHVTECIERNCSTCLIILKLTHPTAPNLKEEYLANRAVIDMDMSPSGRFFAGLANFEILPNLSPIHPPPQQCKLNTPPTQSTHDSGEKLENTSSTSTEPQPTEKPYDKDEIYKMFNPIVNQLLNCSESYFFVEPVDPVKLGIPDYFDIIREPMDLGTVSKKLSVRYYNSPWDVIYDVNLVFDNAYLYNKKNTKVHKFAAKLSTRFEMFSSQQMRSLGYCCNKRYVYSPKSLFCNSTDYCVIRPNASYYRHKDIVFCIDCIKKSPSDVIICNGETQNDKKAVNKSEFVLERNNRTEYEPFIVCVICRKKYHKVCAMHVDNIDGLFHYCDVCFKSFSISRMKNKFVSRHLPRTSLSDYIESNVNNFLVSEFKDSAHVNIRIICSVDKFIETKECIGTRFGAAHHKRFPYKSKAIFAFQEFENKEVCFFSLHVQEYGDNCPPPNQRRVNISYLDSVHYFQPKHLKTLLYHEIILNYIGFCKNKGFLYCHIWSCPPCEGDDYIFHCHSFDQKLPKPRRLLEWYTKMIEVSVSRGIVIESQDIHKYFQNQKSIELAVNIPYFEGDYWSNSLDDIINDFEKELKHIHDPPYSKKQDAVRKNNRKMISSPKRNESYTLNQKLLSLMERYREVFFVLRLNPDDVPFIDESEPIFQSDLMDGRSGFLWVCRDNNWEFSSYRHALYSTKATMFIVHQQMFNLTEFTCDKCKAVLTEGNHCDICPNSYDLCDICLLRFNHQHSTVKKEYTQIKITHPPQDNTNSVNQFFNHIDVNQLKSERYLVAFNNFVRVLKHALTCTNTPCVSGCAHLKDIISHSEHCADIDRTKCRLCSQLFAVYYLHACQCTSVRCEIPNCSRLKSLFLHSRMNRSSKTRSRIHNMAEQINSLNPQHKEIDHNHQKGNCLNAALGGNQSMVVHSQTKSQPDFTQHMPSPSRASSSIIIGQDPYGQCNHPYLRCVTEKPVNHQKRAASRPSRSSHNNMNDKPIESIQPNAPSQNSSLTYTSNHTPTMSTPILPVDLYNQEIQRRTMVQPVYQNMNSITHIDTNTAMRLGILPRGANQMNPQIFNQQTQFSPQQIAYLNQLNQFQNMRMAAVNQMQQPRQMMNNPNNMIRMVNATSGRQPPIHQNMDLNRMNQNMMHHPMNMQQNIDPTRIPIQMMPPGMGQNTDNTRIPMQMIPHAVNIQQNTEHHNLAHNLIINPRMMQQNAVNPQMNNNQQMTFGDVCFNNMGGNNRNNSGGGMNGGTYFINNNNNIPVSQLTVMANQQNALILQQMIRNQTYCGNGGMDWNNRHNNQSNSSISQPSLPNLTLNPNITSGQLVTQMFPSSLSTPIINTHPPSTRPSGSIIPPGFNTAEMMNRPMNNMNHFPPKE